MWMGWTGHVARTRKMRDPCYIFVRQLQGVIWGSHGGEYEDCCLLGCSAVQSGRSLPSKGESETQIREEWQCELGVIGSIYCLSADGNLCWRKWTIDFNKIREFLGQLLKYKFCNEYIVQQSSLKSMLWYHLTESFTAHYFHCYV
jgi:hypothetical protein